MEELVREFLALPKSGKKQVLLGQILGYLCSTEYQRPNTGAGSIGILQGKLKKKYQIYAEKIYLKAFLENASHKLRKVSVIFQISMIFLLK